MSTNYASTPLRGIRALHYFLHGAASLALAAALVNHFVLTSFQVEGHSMDITMHNKQLLAVDLVRYRFAPPKLNDIVILAYAGDQSVHFVKRIIGTPNQSVTVDGTTWQLGPDQYFVAGDNRSHSTDSRTYGPIGGNQIIGKVLGH